MKKLFGCTNKMFWLTEAEARTYHRRIKFRSSGSKSLHFYKCRYADHWHMSRMSKMEFKNRGFRKPKLFIDHLNEKEK